jgi:hypothetical protein
MLVYVVRDLLFVSKIREAAESAGVEAQAVRDVETLPSAAYGAGLVVLDLGLPQAMRALERLAGDPATAAVPSVGFVGHERLDLIETARALGCHQVMAKGEFATKLPAILADPRLRLGSG